MKRSHHASPGSPARALKRVASLGALMLVFSGGALILANTDPDHRRTDHHALGMATVQHGALEIRVSTKERSRATDLGTIEARFRNDPRTDELRFQLQLQLGPLLLELRLRVF